MKLILKICSILAWGIFCGAVVWALSEPITGMREPFDSLSPYYNVAIFIAGILAALPAPRFWWLALIGIFIGERVYAFIFLPETRGWELFGIFVNLVILSWLPAAVGALSVYLVSHFSRNGVSKENSTNDS